MSVWGIESVEGREVDKGIMVRIATSLFSEKQSTPVTITNAYLRDVRPPGHGVSCVRLTDSTTLLNDGGGC